MQRSRQLTEKIQDILFQGQSSVGPGDAIRDGGTSVGPPYQSAPGKGQASSTNGQSSQSGDRSLYLGGWGWMNTFASPMSGCVCPKCKRSSKRPSDQRCKDTHCPYCGTKMKSSE
jgi:hypothetical protein